MMWVFGYVFLKLNGSYVYVKAEKMDTTYAIVGLDAAGYTTVMEINDSGRVISSKKFAASRNLRRVRYLNGRLFLVYDTLIVSITDTNKW